MSNVLGILTNLLSGGADPSASAGSRSRVLADGMSFDQFLQQAEAQNQDDETAPSVATRQSVESNVPATVPSIPPSSTPVSPASTLVSTDPTLLPADKTQSDSTLTTFTSQTQVVVENIHLSIQASSLQAAIRQVSQLLQQLSSLPVEQGAALVSSLTGGSVSQSDALGFVKTLQDILNGAGGSGLLQTPSLQSALLDRLQQDPQTLNPMAQALAAAPQAMSLLSGLTSGVSGAASSDASQSGSSDPWAGFGITGLSYSSTELDVATAGAVLTTGQDLGSIQNPSAALQIPSGWKVSTAALPGADTGSAQSSALQDLVNLLVNSNAGKVILTQAVVYEFALRLQTQSGYWNAQASQANGDQDQPTPSTTVPGSPSTPVSQTAPITSSQTPTATTPVAPSAQAVLVEWQSLFAAVQELSVQAGSNPSDSAQFSSLPGGVTATTPMPTTQTVVVPALTIPTDGSDADHSVLNADSSIPFSIPLMPVSGSQSDPTSLPTLPVSVTTPVPVSQPTSVLIPEVLAPAVQAAPVQPAGTGGATLLSETVVSYASVAAVFMSGNGDPGAQSDPTASNPLSLQADVNLELPGLSLNLTNQVVLNPTPIVQAQDQPAVVNPSSSAAQTNNGDGESVLSSTLSVELLAAGFSTQVQNLKPAVQPASSTVVAPAQAVVTNPSVSTVVPPIPAVATDPSSVSTDPSTDSTSQTVITQALVNTILNASAPNGSSAAPAPQTPAASSLPVQNSVPVFPAVTNPTVAPPIVNNVTQVNVNSQNDLSAKPKIDFSSNVGVAGSSSKTDASSSAGGSNDDPSQPTQASSVIQQISDQVSLESLRTHTVTRLSFDLIPDSLGKVTIQVGLVDQTVTARILVSHPEVQEALQNHMIELRTALNQAGLQIDQLQVQVQGGGAGLLSQYYQFQQEGYGRQTYSSQNTAVYRESAQAVETPVAPIKGNWNLVNLLV